MASPRQVKVEITYDGTTKKNVIVTSSNITTSNSMSYTVVRGDCLWNIAKRFLGSGSRYKEIYNANIDVIESTAKQHGKANSQNGNWIWPGEILAIPGQTQSSSSTDQTIIQSEGVANSELGKKIEKQIIAFSYIDVASGQSDSVSITMHDIGKEWMNGLMPRRGADLGAKVIASNWNGVNSFNCGTFILDDISFSGKPTTCVLGGVSVPAMDDFKSLPVTHTWGNATIEQIASQIAQEAGVALYYDAQVIQIAEIEQSRQTNSAFLYQLCEKYDLAMKVYNHKIVIFGVVAYEEKDAVLTLSEGDMERWSYNTTIDGTYTGVSFNYTNPDTGDPINVFVGEEGRTYSINTQAANQYDAELQAAAKVNQANRSIETMEVVISARTGIVASQCIQISGFGKIDGKYYIDKIKHSINKGYTMSLSLHKVQAAIKITAPSPAAVVPSKTYTVISGDTLWGISKKFYGTGAKYSTIYEANTDIIESTAKQHGKANSQNGNWIWPGETLIIPEV